MQVKRVLLTVDIFPIIRVIDIRVDFIASKDSRKIIFNN